MSIYRALLAIVAAGAVTLVSAQQLPINDEQYADPCDPIEVIAWAVSFAGSEINESSNDGRVLASFLADPAQNCRERSTCCRVCSGGKACGDSCIRRDYNCRRGRGCACNASEICRSGA